MAEVNLLEILEALVKRALKKGADQAETFAIQSLSQEVWLGNNSIKTVKSTPGLGMGLRIIKGKSQGFASINNLDEASFDDLIQNALAFAKANLTDRYLLIPEPADIIPLNGLYDPRLEALPLKETINMAKTLLRSAKDFDKRVTVDSGTVAVSAGQKAVYNSLGISAQEKSTGVYAMIFGMARDKKEVSCFDYQSDASRKLSGIRIDQTGKRLAQNVVRSLGAKPARSFKGTVMLSPYALEGIFLYPLIYSVNAQNVQKGVSALAGKLGAKIASSKLTILDDGLLRDGLASSAFDREGQPHKTLKIIDKGRLKTYLYNSYAAARDGVNTTGNAAGSYRSIPGISATNIVFSPGATTKGELIKSIKEGILVTRFSGNVNPVSGVFSGTVKGGFYIRNGKIVHPLTNTMIAGNVFEAMTNIKGLSKKLVKVESSLLPYMVIGGVSITSG
ncbi:TldD/PmbA family protein [candidate division WOR-3 bacterium]|nr:TldD/PmbA family protein [candidate division WOR-3 bacterium]